MINIKQIQGEEILIRYSDIKKEIEKVTGLKKFVEWYKVDNA